MGRFFLVDHSLAGVGGHHYDYALHVLRAAEELGFDVVLAVNRKLRSVQGFPLHWPVLPVFRHHTYSRYAVFQDSGPPPLRVASGALRLVPGDAHPNRPAFADSKWMNIRQRAEQWWQQKRGNWNVYNQQRRIDRFAASCEKVFRRYPLSKGDHVFFPTISEFDLRGLVSYLQNHPGSQKANWHLQFHFNIFDGREPDYVDQYSRRQRVEEKFREALRPVSGHRLFFYNTSDALTRQYQRLNVGRFDELSYPINPAFYRPGVDAGIARDDENSTRKRPLRITCAGALRREKGQQLLSQLTGDLWNAHFSRGEVQLVVQSNKSRFRIPIPNQGRFQQGRFPKFFRVNKTTDSSPVVYVPHPLREQAYVSLIRRADIGLLMYDSDRYYARRAGILGELLAAGVPVVVPAGCWLSEQIAEPNHSYLEKLCQSASLTKTHSGSELKWTHRADEQLILKVFEVCPPTDANLVVLSFKWAADSPPGVFARVAIDGGGSADSPHAWILGQRSGNRRVYAAARLAPRRGLVRIRVENAYHPRPLRITQLKIYFLRALGERNQPLPLGAVGLAAADASQIRACLEEIIRRHDHYRRSCAEFATGWFDRHTPRRTIEQLVTRTHGERSELKTA